MMPPMTARFRAPGYDLAATLDCGQFFRAAPLADGSWRVVTHGRILRAWTEADDLVVEGWDPASARRFFGVDAGPLPPSGDPAVDSAREISPGLHLLRQDPWECTAAFIASQVSNIPRISRNLADISEAFGRTIRPGEPRAFPRPAELGTEADLRAIGLGFRARYLAVAAARGEEYYARLDGLPLDDVRAALLALPGVAEKVADCIALFGCGCGEAFPIDTWIRRAVHARFRRGSDDELRRWARGRFGERAGLVQQHLFVWARANLRTTGAAAGPA